MARLYTPFLERGAANLGGAMAGRANREQLEGLTKSAYMGDPEAMAQLTAVNPQIANQIQQSQRQRQQDQLAQAGQQRQQSAQSEQLVQGVMKQAAQLGSYEEALAYTENAKSKYEAANLIQPGQYEPLTEADYDQIKQIFGPKAEKGPSELDQARTAKIYAEIDNMYGEGSDESLKLKKSLLDIEKKKLDITKAKRAPKLTADEAKASGFYDRMISSQGEIDRVLSESPDFEPSAFGETAPAAISNTLASPEFQQYKQAADDWIRAKLRRESGAVIGAEEMTSEYKNYFPEFGDSSQVIEQKKRARRTAEKAMGKALSGAAKVEEAVIDKASKVVARRGTYKGKSVIEYADGTVEYAN